MTPLAVTVAVGVGAFLLGIATGWLLRRPARRRSSVQLRDEEARPRGRGLHRRRRR